MPSHLMHSEPHDASSKNEPERVPSAAGELTSSIHLHHDTHPERHEDNPHNVRRHHSSPLPMKGKGRELSGSVLPHLSQSNPGRDVPFDSTSNTWTSSSVSPGDHSDDDAADDRDRFIEAYNRLAHQNGLRSIIPGDFPDTQARETRQSSWLSQVLRHASEQSAQDSRYPGGHQRSLSDVALILVNNNHKRDALKDRGLRELIRLCGKSTFYLPPDYAPCSLVLPTCFRALAQELVQHADTKGIFRVPGSMRVSNSLYEYYSAGSKTRGVSSTTMCPAVPGHIKCNPHDIASTFKRLLAGLPGGILGSLSVFDALVAVYGRLQMGPELYRTKETKLRARLIALAIGTVKSQYQRELICSVFGLLCLVGRIAETAAREDEKGHPLPTTQLMGYHALGITFGPLLIGDLIDTYVMKMATFSTGLVLLPIARPMSRKERHQQRRKEHKERHRQKHRQKHAHQNHPHANRHDEIACEQPSTALDKIHVANAITEMLIVNWREVVRQMRSLGSVKSGRQAESLHERLESDISLPGVPPPMAPIMYMTEPTTASKKMAPDSSSERRRAEASTQPLMSVRPEFLVVPRLDNMAECGWTAQDPQEEEPYDIQCPIPERTQVQPSKGCDFDPQAQERDSPEIECPTLQVATRSRQRSSRMPKAKKAQECEWKPHGNRERESSEVKDPSLLKATYSTDRLSKESQAKKAQECEWAPRFSSDLEPRDLEHLERIDRPPSGLRSSEAFHQGIQGSKSPVCD
ncbi:hypothetical protein F5Y18DRAFT_160413 [Xylariaceae sp. FL1019]|nr:hypothetical protein F5Y18DRAFT_160413 [Xylariaceae sp. FL1019]